MQKYLCTFQLGIQNAMEYRANFLLSMVSAVWPTFIQFFLWTSIYRGDTAAVINGYTYVQIIAYTLMANIVSRLIRTGFEYEINEDIKNGGLNKFIVKPVDYFCYKLSSFLGQKLIQTAFLLLLIGGVLLLLRLRFGMALDLLRIGVFFLSLLLAFCLNFMIFFSVGMMAFWLFEVGFLFEAIRIVIIMLSGGIFPLDIFGAGVSRALGFLPFKYTISFPVELINSRLEPFALGRGLLVQIFWIILLTGIARLLWRAGSKRYVAVGG
ncbi:ABC-2 type transport system permease protein [Hydrogenispora ethanolica]|uniref:ABC-2 type transport system permease protein n=1 Tax=Hydrogenispora ethanolica TaxID=1082276 RepID=A0A4R1S9C5_HYDET|nr:ABC-2 family transporter protein [Hydrogenispora ethanolica]TCL75112.1 ABC-2 type transport system permease protein [Hydrogenispora ethanolica]